MDIVGGITVTGVNQELSSINRTLCIFYCDVITADTI